MAIFWLCPWRHGLERQSTAVWPRGRGRAKGNVLFVPGCADWPKQAMLIRRVPRTWESPGPGHRARERSAGSSGRVFYKSRFPGTPCQMPEQIMVKDRCGGKLCWSFFLPEKEKPAAFSCRLCHHTAALRTALICFCHLFRNPSTARLRTLTLYLRYFCTIAPSLISAVTRDLSGIALRLTT